MIEKNPKILGDKKELELSVIEGENGVQFLLVPELAKTVPIYEFRNLNHQVLIARSLAVGERMAMFGGVWGAFKAVKQNTTVEDFFHKQVKPGRPWEAKVPLMIRPQDGVRLVDWSAVHPAFRFLQDYWKFKKLWSTHGAFLHIIAPVRPTLESLPDIFKTTPQDYQNRYKGADKIPVSTIAILHRYDPYLEHLSALVERFSHTAVYLGVSTLNPHGEEPPYTEDEFLQDIKTRRCNINAIDLIARDRKYQKTGAFSSHTQIRLPFAHEEPVFRVIRIGSLSPDGFKDATGFDYVIEKDAKDVRRNKGENLDGKLSAMIAEIESRWQKERPLIYFRA